MHANYIIFSILICIPPLNAMQPTVSSQRQLQEVAIGEKQPEVCTLATIASDNDIDSDKSSTTSSDTPPPIPSESEESDSLAIAATLATEIAAKQKLAQENSRLKKEIEKLPDKAKKTPAVTDQNKGSEKETQELSASTQGESALKVECCACGKCEGTCKCKTAAKYGASGAIGFGIGASVAQAGCCILL